MPQQHGLGPDGKSRAEVFELATQGVEPYATIYGPLAAEEKAWEIETGLKKTVNAEKSASLRHL